MTESEENNNEDKDYEPQSDESNESSDDDKDKDYEPQSDESNESSFDEITDKEDNEEISKVKNEGMKNFLILTIPISSSF